MVTMCIGFNIIRIQAHTTVRDLHTDTVNLVYIGAMQEVTRKARYNA